MKFDKHGNGHGLDDLYCLPETEKEKNLLVSWLRAKERGFTISWANVEGHEWYGKSFIEIPFGENLRTEIENKVIK